MAEEVKHTPAPEHCGHECVCMSYYHNAAQKFARACVLDRECQYNTRSRQAQRPDALSELEQWIHKNSMKVRADLVDMVYSYKLLQEIARLRGGRR